MTKQGEAKTKVLVTSPSDSYRKILSSLLGESDYTVIAAQTVSESINILNDNPEIEVVFCEHRIGRESGMDLLRLANESFENVKIVILSEDSQATEKNLAKELGAKGWLNKPFDESKLVHLVKYLENM